MVGHIFIPAVLGLLLGGVQDPAPTTTDEPRSAADTLKAEFKAIQGTWQGTAFELGGRTAPADFVSKGRYVFEDDRLTMYEGKDVVGKVRFELHPEWSPRGIDLVSEEAESGKIKRIEGIYRMEDGVLRLCFSTGRRPSAFESKGDNGLMTFARPGSHTASTSTSTKATAGSNP